MNKYDKYAIDVIKDPAIVGYLPHYLSADLFKVLESGGDVKVVITSDPIYTMTRGLIIPFTSLLCGEEALIKDVKENLVYIYWSER